MGWRNFLFWIALIFIFPASASLPLKPKCWELEDFGQCLWKGSDGPLGGGAFSIEDFDSISCNGMVYVKGVALFKVIAIRKFNYSFCDNMYLEVQGFNDQTVSWFICK